MSFPAGTKSRVSWRDYYNKLGHHNLRKSISLPHPGVSNRSRRPGRHLVRVLVALHCWRRSWQSDALATAVAGRDDTDQRSAAGMGREVRAAAASSAVRRSHHACGRIRSARSQVASSRLAPMLMVPIRLSTNHSSSASPPGDEYSRRALPRNPRGSVCLYPSRRNCRRPPTRPYSST